MTTALPASPVFYCGLSSLGTHPCTQDQAAAERSQPRRTAWGGWQVFSGRPGVVEHSRALRVHLGKSHFPGENGVTEKISDWS